MIEIAAIFLIFFYFLPSLIAANRKHLNTRAIFVLNLFLGWTFLGWVAAIVWASTDHVRTRLVTARFRRKSRTQRLVEAAAVAVLLLGIIIFGPGGNKKDQPAKPTATTQIKAY